jgi:ferritin-like metal-binding protein YciE
MKRINSLNDLLMEELADLLNAESQLVEALPKMADAGHSSVLKSVLEDCLAVTKEHVKRLEDIFNTIGQEPQKLTCKAMKGLLTESEDIVNKTKKGPDLDADIISLAQRVQEYEIARYKAVREHAADLGHSRIVKSFTKSLNEHRAMNFHFNEMAQGMINVQASGGGFYIPEGKFSRKGIMKKTKSTDVSRFISEGNPNIQDQNL